MEFEFKDKDQLVNDVIASISNKIPDIDFSDGEPLRTIIEAIMNELDLQYWQIEQTYDNSFIDTAYGEDLDKLVKLLGVERVPAVNSTGRVKFYRQTNATMDYIIPAGTLIETMPDNEGNIVRFETLQNATLTTGQKEVYANVQSIEPGLKSNVVANKVIIINNPPIGIESVINTETIIGGEDEETDEELRTRTKSALEASGLGTISAIENKIKIMPGIKSVKVLDMARGIGTMNILVLGDTLPMPASKITEINNTIQSIKAGGIDFLVVEPVVNTVNLDITLTLKSGVVLNDVSTTVNAAINNYFKNLQIGYSFIKNQLAKDILNSSDGILDIVINTPSANVTPNPNDIVVLGTITLH